MLAAHTWLVYVFLYAPDRDPRALFVQQDAARPPSGRASRSTGTAAPRTTELILRAVRNSLVVGVATTVIATVIGTLAALASRRYEFRGKGLTQSLLYLPIIIPEIVIGAALVTFFGAARLRLSICTVVIAHVVFSVSLRRDRRPGAARRASTAALEEAALDLGARPVETFRA